MTEKKKYEAPEMKVHQVKPASIICTSLTSTQNEEYGTFDTQQTTGGWTWN